jgi:hypothetical protein
LSVEGFALPDNQTGPTVIAELGTVFPVALSVVSELLRPINSVRLWCMAVYAAAVLVPRTAMDKDDFSP